MLNVVSINYCEKITIGNFSSLLFNKTTDCVTECTAARSKEPTYTCMGSSAYDLANLLTPKGQVALKSICIQ